MDQKEDLDKDGGMMSN